MPPFQQQGQAYNWDYGGSYPMNTATTDQDTDCGMSGPSDFYAHSADYQNSLPFGAGYGPRLSQNEDKVPSNGSIPISGQPLTDPNLPVDLFLDRQGSWSTVGPLRQDSLPMDPQYWQGLLAEDMLMPQDQEIYAQTLTPGDLVSIAASQAYQEASFDAGAPLFPVDPNATNGFVEHPGLRIQPGEGPFYSPNLDVPLDAAETSRTTASQSQGDAAYIQRSQFVCATCGKEWKSNTDLKKCDARHKRPHCCPRVDCKKNKDGFATRNDADRHCDSVHQEDLDGNPRPPRPCPWEGCARLFPQTRNDNLKHHLTKAHHMAEKEADKLIVTLATPRIHHNRRTHHRFLATPAVEDYSTHEVHGQGSAQSSAMDSLRRSLYGNEVSDGPHGDPFLPVHTSMEHQANPGSYGQSSNRAGDFINPTLASRETLETKTRTAVELQSWEQNSIPSPQQTGAKISSQEDFMSGSSFSSIPSYHEKQKMQQPCQTRAGIPIKSPQKIVEDVLGVIRSEKPRSLSHSFSAMNAPIRPSLQTYQTAPNGDYSAVDEAPHSSYQSLDAIKAAKIVHALKDIYVLQEKDAVCATEAPSNVSTPAGSPANSHPPDCKTCIKLEDSPCQKRKHLKRGAQPYYCPAAKCMKRCGSKSDIMRHHNSQHDNLEKWRCGVQQDGLTCGKDFNHQTSLQQHLERQHKIRSDDAKGLVRKLRIVNQDYPREFWCGICGYWLGLYGEAEARRDLMFNHFEDHLDARNDEQTGSAEDWQPQPRGACRLVERTLKRQISGRHSGASFRNRVESESPIAPRQASQRSSMRPQPSQTSSLADHKRQLSLSPRLRPRMESKRLKSDGELGRKGKERESGGTRSRNRPSFTIKCCYCVQSFGNEMTGLCDCGHIYCSGCTKEEVQQLEEEFNTCRGGRQDKSEHGGGHGTYLGLDSRST